MPGKPAVFLDRDNTIIRNDGDLGDPAQVEMIQGSAMAIASLCGLGFKVFVVTNQGGVARGKYTEEDVDAVHDRLREMVEHAANGARIEGFYFCPYHPEGTVKKYKREHDDRKPRPGMILRAAEEHGLDLTRSWMVGDGLRDVAAGNAAGCRTIWVNGFAKPDETPGNNNEHDDTPDYITGTLVEAVRIIGTQRHTRDEPRRPASPPGPAPPLSASHSAEHHTERDTAADEHAGSDAHASSPTTTPAPSTKPAPRPFRPYALPPSGPAAPPPAEPLAKLRLAEMVNKVRGVSTRSARREGATEIDGTASESRPQHDRDRVVSGADQDNGSVHATDVPATPQIDVSADVPEVDTSRVAETTAPPAPARKPTPSPSFETDTGDDPELAPPSPTPNEFSADAPGQQKLLRLILQELRGQRGGGDHASAATIVAMVFQAIAGVCLLGGLWMGAGDDGLFMRWLGAAVIVQLAVIALLLFARSGRG